jgi:2-dehydro-3-deoxygluconokinase
MDLVTFGEAMVRLSPPEHQSLEEARSFDAYIGGAELNVAVAAAHLGVVARWVSRLPENALGRMIANRARAHRVDAHVLWGDASDRAGLYFIEQGSAPRQTNVLYDRAASAMSRLGPGTIDWKTVLTGARWFHVSGITPALSESVAAATQEALQAAKDAGVMVSLDVNYRVKLWSAERARIVLEPLLRHVDLLIASEDDARRVFAATGNSPARVAAGLAERLHVAAVAITIRDSGDGSGAVVAADGSVFMAPRHDVDVVDRVGAGDAFSAGLIASRLENRGWEDAARFATALAALKLRTPGDFSTSRHEDVERMLLDTPTRASR